MKTIVLVINPGSTSTKVALFAEGQHLAEESISHSKKELAQYKGVIQQRSFREAEIQRFLDQQTIDQQDIAAVVGRGGLVDPVPGGTFLVDEKMLADILSEKNGSHASNLGAILANDFAEKFGVKAYIVDPVVVDEFTPVARISGLKGIERRSVGHPLNQKAVARKILAEIGKSYKTSSVVVAHLGGGISVGAHQNGRIIDLSNGLDGEGPYTPERTGALPVTPFVAKVLQEGLTLPEVKKTIAGNGGLSSYLDEIDIRVIEKRIQAGDEEAQYYIDGMCYQIQKEIGAMAAVLHGKVDRIILTGGVSYSKNIVAKITEGVAWIAPVAVAPGEMEMEALYAGAQRVLDGSEAAQVY
ncbi:butyrate kinase [Enterococcus sp. LJL90]